MKFYRLKGVGGDIKENILKDYNNMLEEFSEQKESDEYINIKTIHDMVEKFDFSVVQNIMSSDFTSYCWLNTGRNGKVYINIKNEKGYRYTIKNNCLGGI